MIDEQRAREIASAWHGGQGSALYAFASSGNFDADRMAVEIRECAEQAGPFNIKPILDLYAYAEVRLNDPYTPEAVARARFKLGGEDVINVHSNTIPGRGDDGGRTGYGVEVEVACSIVFEVEDLEEAQEVLQGLAGGFSLGGDFAAVNLWIDGADGSVPVEEMV